MQDKDNIMTVEEVYFAVTINSVCEVKKIKIFSGRLVEESVQTG